MISVTSIRLVCKSGGVAVTCLTAVLRFWNQILP